MPASKPQLELVGQTVKVQNKSGLMQEEFETESIVRKVVNWFIWYPFVTMVSFLPFGLGVWLLTRCQRTKIVREFAASYKALETIYTYDGFTFKSGRKIDGFFQWLWVGNVRNARAVRNRLRMVKSLIHQVMTNFAIIHRPINIVSLGSGSARAIISTIAEFVNQNLVSSQVNATLVDMSRSALTYSRDLSGVYGVDHLITTLRAHVLKLNGRLQMRPNIVEVVGLAEYLDDENFTALVGEIYELLDRGGVLLISNIVKNPELRFMETVLDWHMIYRTKTRLKNLVEDGGFDPAYITVYSEPLGIHLIAMAKKL